MCAYPVDGYESPYPHTLRVWVGACGMISRSASRMVIGSPIPDKLPGIGRLDTTRLISTDTRQLDVYRWGPLSGGKPPRGGIGGGVFRVSERCVFDE